MRDAIGLVGRLNEHFFYAADIVAERVVGLGADDFCGVQHGCSFAVRAASAKATFRPNAGFMCAAKKKARAGNGTGHGRAEIAPCCYRPGLASLSPHNSQVERTDTCGEVPCPSRAIPKFAARR